MPPNEADRRPAANETATNEQADDLEPILPPTTDKPRHLRRVEIDRDPRGRWSVVAWVVAP